MQIAKLEQGFIKYLKRDKIHSAALCYVDGAKSGLFTYGFLDENKQTPVSKDSIFEIGSVTKPIVATIFTILNKRGRIDIQGSVGEYLKKYELNNQLKEIPIIELLTHSSGLPRLPVEFYTESISNPYKNISEEQFQRFLLNFGLMGTRGKYRYSNFGYGILGEILREVCGADLQKIAEEQLFNSLEMNHTSFTKPVDEENIISGYDIKNQRTPGWDFSFFQAAGSITSSIKDMSKFLLANLECNNTSICETHTLSSKNVAIGWHYKTGVISKILGYQKYYWHNGQTGGFSSFLAFNKEKQCGFVVLLNKSVFPDPYFYHLSSYFY